MTAAYVSGASKGGALSRRKTNGVESSEKFGDKRAADLPCMTAVRVAIGVRQEQVVTTISEGKTLVRDTALSTTTTDIGCPGIPMVREIVESTGQTKMSANIVLVDTSRRQVPGRAGRNDPFVI